MDSIDCIEPERDLIVRCVVDGITVDDSVHIPLTARGLIDRSAAAITRLLDAFGQFTILNVPQFSTHMMLLEVLPLSATGLRFDLHEFEVFIRTLAELIDARNEGRSPISSALGGARDDMETIATRLSGLGSVRIKLHSSSTIELKFGRRARLERRTQESVISRVDTYSEVHQSFSVVLMSSDEASDLRVGDRLELKFLSPIDSLDCSVARLVWIEDRAVQELDLVDSRCED